MMNTSARLVQSIKSRRSLIGVIGLGYIGLPLAISFVEAGFQVLGFDEDATKIASINSGKSYLHHIDDTSLASHVTKGKLQGTSDMSRLSEPDVILICVPTPTTEKSEPNLIHLSEAIQNIAIQLRQSQLICLESTSYPGTTHDMLLPAFQTPKLVVGTDFFLGFSPEREDPGNSHFHITAIPKIVSGVTNECLQVVTALYSEVFAEVFPVSSTKTAECTKLIENIYRHVNIGFVNELKQILSHMEVDIWEVLEAASTKPFGFQAFYPGPGIGGHCIPNNPIYFLWKAKQLGMTSQIIDSALSVNDSMASYVVKVINDSLQINNQNLNESQILVLGITYKADVQDTRESPAFPIMNLLQEKGATVHYSDPYVPSIETPYSKDFDIKSTQITKEVLKTFNLVLLITDHSSFPYQLIQENSSLIVDTRNIFRRHNLTGPHIVQA